jgi:ppGpp synthetase/RelA/SpoT-type nucleotidyltranferase
MTTSEAISWYSSSKPLYDQLAIKVESIVKEIINDKNTPIHAIFNRAKEVDSFAKKIEDPKYTDPTSQITDLAGIRVIVYVENDLEIISKIINDNFEVDPENSVDKSKSLGVDKVGYRSIHFIAQLPSDRIKLPEYKKFDGIKFEIQIRTILQHAWAEIEHDKDYKFSGELPTHLKRRFKVLAGVLELADREFNSIASEIDQYALKVNSQTKQGDLNISIDSTSIKSYLSFKFEDLIEKNKLVANFTGEDTERIVLNELKLFGIDTLKKLDAIIPKDFSERAIKNGNYLTTYTGILRHLMLINDSKKYFSVCWNNYWKTININSVNLIKTYDSSIEKQVQDKDIRLRMD